MQLGRGRPISQDKWFDLFLWSAPWWGHKLLELLKPFKVIDTDALNAVNPFQLWCGAMGTGKTNLARFQIHQQIDAGLGGIVMDAKEGQESLCTYTIQRLAEVGKDPEHVFILDFFSPFGSPQIDLLYDAQDDEISNFTVVEELVSATALLSTARSSPGAREISMARMSWLSLMLAGPPTAAGDIAKFLTDEGFRANVVKKAGHPDLEKFWLGDKAYFKSLPRDVLESCRNKWDNVCLHPAIKPCISTRDTKGEFAQLFEFMQKGGWWIVPISENKLKYELRLTIAQIVQYMLKVATLKREEVSQKLLFLGVLDEYPQYKSPITHTDLLRLARSQNLGLIFLCQDMGIFSDEEFRALSGCATIGTFSCDRSSAEDMVRQIFQPTGHTFKDWEGTKNYSVRDELDNYIALVMSQERGEAIVRIKQDTKAYFLEVPFVLDPQVTSEQEWAFREAVAKRWYRKPSRTRP